MELFCETFPFKLTPTVVVLPFVGIQLLSDVKTTVALYAIGT